jgi:hypothetical protein
MKATRRATGVSEAEVHDVFPWIPRVCLTCQIAALGIKGVRRTASAV